MKTIKVNYKSWDWLTDQKKKMKLRSIDVLISKIIKLIKHDKLQKNLQVMN